MCTEKSDQSAILTGIRSNDVHSDGFDGGGDGQWESKAEKGKRVCPHEEICMPPDIIFEWTIQITISRYCD